MNHLIIGMGEIGKSVKQVLSAGDNRIYSCDIREDKEPTGAHIDVMHVCFPYSESFVGDVEDYQEIFKPDHLIVWSTVPIGTTRLIPKAVHSPVEGRHPEIASSIRIMPRWIGYNDPKEANFFAEMFLELELRISKVPNTDFTEFLKLRSTAKYGINIVWTNYEKRVADEIGMDFELLKQFDTDYNKLYRDLNMDWARRYILDPPKGQIGGHCVVPNAEMLDNQFPNDLLKMIAEFK